MIWPKPYQSRRENPAVKAGLFRVYGVVNNYRTNFDDFKEVYLLGIQSAFSPFLYSLGVLPSVRLR